MPRLIVNNAILLDVISIEVIEDLAFNGCAHLVQVETHDGIRKVGKMAFHCCRSLKSIDLRSVLEIGMQAFDGCAKGLKLPSIITVKLGAFRSCKALTSIEFSERLETIEPGALRYCDRIQQIAIPLKRDLLSFDRQWQEYNQFDSCDLLTAVDLVGGSHNKTIASLHMERLRTAMKEEINRINQVLPNKPADEKTVAIKQWVDSVIDKMDHYKAEHHRYVREALTLLELALWKAKLDEKQENSEEGKTKKAKLDGESVRKEKRVTCGADTVIKNILPFLK
eukprot:scaffold1262_cov77-Skeletonema_marinoi.AAC.1